MTYRSCHITIDRIHYNNVEDIQNWVRKSFVETEQQEDPRWKMVLMFGYLNIYFRDEKDYTWFLTACPYYPETGDKY